MIEIEGFDAVISQLMLAKKLYDIDRFDIVERQFHDVLSWDSYYENMLEVMSSVFSEFYNSYDDDECIDLMVFEDDCISNYFVHAWEYGKLHKLPYNQNPYLIQAQNAVREWLGVSHCVGWRLLGYTKTKKKAQQSKLVVEHYTDCGCNAYEHIAFGLIQLYAWFVEQCAEFKTLEEITPNKNSEETTFMYHKSENQGVKAA